MRELSYARKVCSERIHPVQMGKHRRLQVGSLFAADEGEAAEGCIEVPYSEMEHLRRLGVQGWRWGIRYTGSVFGRSIVGLEVVRPASGRGMPLGCSLLKEEQQRPAGKLVPGCRACLGFHPCSYIAHKALESGREACHAVALQAW